MGKAMKVLNKNFEKNDEIQILRKKVFLYFFSKILLKNIKKIKNMKKISRDRPARWERSPDAL